MTKRQGIFFGIAAFLLWIVGPALIEVKPIAAITAIAIAAVLVRTAERG